jgi:CheY-like chemotaxis protein/anti-sigma regulatory factor (Ser/Thr protein kinase)
MSHEIRTPITALLGISEIHLRGGKLPPHLVDPFAKIYTSSKSLLAIVNDILDLSKVESGKMTLSNDCYALTSLAGDVAQLHLVYAEQGDVSFNMHVDENLPLSLIGDVLRIRQVITNLLTNAFKYTISGTVTLSLSGTPLNNGQYMLHIRIEDTGLGMTDEQLHALKHEYTRFHEQQRPFTEGTGLGIPIVYSLAQLMDAQFELTSEQGQGTVATISIPQDVADATILGEELAYQLANFEIGSWHATRELDFKPQAMAGRVLVVDDVDTNLYVAEAMLESFGLTIELADSGEEALKKAQKGYDIIFMDHMMPGMDGLQATAALRARGYNAPIVALTANAVKGQAEMFLSAGFDDFLAKPIDFNLLSACLHRFLKQA